MCKLKALPLASTGLVANDEICCSRQAFIEDFRDDTNVSVGIGGDDHG